MLKIYIRMPPNCMKPCTIYLQYISPVPKHVIAAPREELVVAVQNNLWTVNPSLHFPLIGL